MPVITLTGATGRIGTALRARIPRDGETWRLVDLRPVTDPRPHEEAVTADLADLEAVTGVVEGSDTVVHLAAVSTESSFDDICRHNLVATYNVFEAARVTGVRRVVFASTMHVTGFYPWDATLTPDAPVRPDTLYGVSKAYGEALGRLYADKHGLEVVAVRIGNFVDRPGRPSDLAEPRRRGAPLPRLPRRRRRRPRRAVRHVGEHQAGVERRRLGRDRLPPRRRLRAVRGRRPR